MTVKDAYSTANHKDGLAITGKSPVVRKWPMMLGIDFARTARTVSASDDPRWMAGDEVILNGWGVGEAPCSGLAQQARVEGNWLVRRPEAVTALDAMAVGTAGQVKRQTCRLDIAPSSRGGSHQPLATGRAAQGLTTVANTFCTTSQRPSTFSKLR